MPEATRSFVNQRTLKESHRRLVDILNVGNDVLDVGCSTGTITSGIAKMVQNGKVIGMDENKTFIKEANKTYAQQRNLSFIAKDIYEIDYLNQFDVVTSARVLQWLSNPEKALKKMVAAAKVVEVWLFWITIMRKFCGSLIHQKVCSIFIKLFCNGDLRLVWIIVSQTILQANFPNVDLLMFIFPHNMK